MSEYKIKLSWQRGGAEFKQQTYPRNHEIAFQGGLKLISSAAPEYLGDSSKANPEELLAAAVSSCHMLTFLAIACKKGLIVDHYEDSASANLGKNSDNKIAVTTLTLKPKVTFSGSNPSQSDLQTLHEKAHEHCFIAQSVNFPIEIKCE